MNSNRVIAQNVLDFIEKAADDYAAMQRERFSYEMRNLMTYGPESPIEQMFFVALHVVCEYQFTRLNEEPWVCPADRHAFLRPGLHVREQAPIGRYRVDFLIEHIGYRADDKYAPVIVELDGHAFHDKDKKQRSYEKARDRFLLREGYRVVHFTGSDVVSDPYRVAWEVVEMFGGDSLDTYYPQIFLEEA